MEELRREARTANARLMTLEKYNAKTPAYDIAVNDIKNITSTGTTRFKYNKDLTPQEARKSLLSAKKFNNSKSSTLKGMREIIKKREFTIQKRYDNVSPSQMSDLYRFFESQSFRAISASLAIGSDQVLQLAINAINNGKSVDELDFDLQKAISEENDGSLLDRIEDLFNSEYDEEYDW